MNPLIVNPSQSLEVLIQNFYPSKWTRGRLQAKKMCFFLFLFLFSDWNIYVGEENHSFLPFAPRTEHCMLWIK